MSHLQTLTKVVTLEPFWANNNYAGYSKYVKDVYNVEKTIASLFLSEDVEVVSIRTTVSINLKDKDKKEDLTSTPKANEALDDSFWVDVATGKYSG